MIYIACLKFRKTSTVRPSILNGWLCFGIVTIKCYKRTRRAMWPTSMFQSWQHWCFRAFSGTT